MKVAKLQGLGNDFLIVEAGAGPELEAPGRFARRLLDRHTGVGADGMIVLGPAGAGAGAGRSEFAFRLYNADGSEAEISGNGLRCAMGYVVHGGKAAGARAVFHTAVGPRALEVVDRSAAGLRIKTELGMPRFESEAIPFADGKTHDSIVDYPLTFEGKTLKITCVSMGNPHCDIFVDGFPDDSEWQGTGRRLESHPFFPKRTNVEFIRVVDRGTIEVRFWERGVGETLSSGTGSAAAAVSAMTKGLTDRKVTVRTPGGELIVEWPKDGQVYQTGPVEFVFEGDYPKCS
jgi:diaminopimelate epimerase